MQIGLLQVFVGGGAACSNTRWPWTQRLVKRETSNETSNGSTRFSCQRCKVPREYLGNSQCDFAANLRSAEGGDADIEWARKGPMAAERSERQRESGVVFPKLPNALEKITMDRVLQIPFGMHADDLVSTLSLPRVHRVVWNISSPAAPLRS